MTDWKDRALTNWKDKALLRAVDAVERHRGLKLRRSFTERIVSIALKELGVFDLVEAMEDIVRCEQRRRRELKDGSPAARFSQKRIDAAVDALAKAKGEG